MDAETLRQLKRTVDTGFREFTRSSGAGLEQFFEPLGDFLLFCERLLTGSPWPLVAIKGIASGRERLVVLDTGEMLSAGERSRTGVRVVRIEPDCAWIAWHGATNMLRKGEDSSKPLLE